MTKEENKALIERTPYLMPRNVFTDEVVDNYDYEYVRGEYELPAGWFRFFLQMCEDIREPLIKANQLDSFRFSQIKEKYGVMECYNFGGTKEVQNIIDDYRYISRFICFECGKPATKCTVGWIESYCDDCYRDFNGNYEELKFNPIRVSKLYSSENDYKPITTKRDCSDIWRRYIENVS